MNETQKKIWNLLTTLSGEEVAQLFTNYSGLQVLDDDFYEFIENEGYSL